MREEKYITRVPDIIIKSNNGEFNLNTLIKVIYEVKQGDCCKEESLLIIKDAFLITNKLRGIFKGDNLSAKIIYYIFDDNNNKYIEPREIQINDLKFVKYINNKNFDNWEGYTTYILSTGEWTNLEIENIVNRENQIESTNKLIEIIKQFNKSINKVTRNTENQ